MDGAARSPRGAPLGTKHSKRGVSFGDIRTTTGIREDPEWATSTLWEAVAMVVGAATHV